MGQQLYLTFIWWLIVLNSQGLNLRKIHIEAENSWVSLSNCQWNPFHLTSWEKLLFSSQTFCVFQELDSKWQFLSSSLKFFVFWSVLNKTRMVYLFSKDGIAFIKKKIQNHKLPEIFCFFSKGFHTKIKLHQKKSNIDFRDIEWQYKILKWKMKERLYGGWYFKCMNDKIG